MTYQQSFYAGLRPDPLITVSEWSDTHRMLSQTASSEPGRWRTDRTPYLREIMDCLSPSHPTEKVIFMKGAQIVGTEAGNNWVGYIIDQAPGPLLVVRRLKWGNAGRKAVWLRSLTIRLVSKIKLKIQDRGILAILFRARNSKAESL